MQPFCILGHSRMNTSKHNIFVLAILIGLILTGCKEAPYINAPGDNNPNLPDRGAVDTTFIDPIADFPVPDSIDGQPVITVKEAIALCKKLPNQGISPVTYYIKGFISQLGDKGDNGTHYAEAYGNCYFYMKDQVTDVEQFYCYQTLWLDGEKYLSPTQCYKGQRLVVKTQLYKYGSTCETPGGNNTHAHVYASSWKEPAIVTTGDGSKENPYTAADVLALSQGLSKETRHEGEIVYVSAYINGCVDNTRNDSVWYEAAPGTWPNRNYLALADNTNSRIDNEQMCIHVTRVRKEGSEGYDVYQALNLNDTELAIWHKPIVLCGELKFFLTSETSTHAFYGIEDPLYVNVGGHEAWRYPQE